MTNQLENELKELIVKSLMLEDVTPEEIETAEPLFGDGLGLDSIDALELALVLNQTYGLKLTSDDEKNRALFHSVQTLAVFIQANRTDQ